MTIPGYELEDLNRRQAESIQVLMDEVEELKARLAEREQELTALRDQLRGVDGFCDVCAMKIEDYAHKYELHGPMADFCSQECFNEGTVPSAGPEGNEGKEKK